MLMKITNDLIEYAGMSSVSLERIVKHEKEGDQALAKIALSIHDIWDDKAIDISKLRSKYGIHERLVEVPMYAKVDNKYIKVNATALSDGTNVYPKYNPRLKYYDEAVFLSIVHKLSIIDCYNIHTVKRFDNNFGYYALITLESRNEFNIYLAVVWELHENAINFRVGIGKDNYFGIIEPPKHDIKPSDASYRQLINALYTIQIANALSFDIFKLKNEKAPLDFYSLIPNLYSSTNAISKEHKIAKAAMLEMSGMASLLDWYIRFVKFLYENDISKTKKPLSNFSVDNFKRHKTILQWLSKKGFLAALQL